MHNSVQSFAREAPIQPKSVSQQERHNHVGGGKQTRPPPFDLYCWTLVVPPPSSIHSNNNNIAAGLDVGVCGWCTYAIPWWGPPFFGQNIYFFSRLGGCPTFLGKHSAKPSPLPFAILPSLPEVRNWGNKKRILWILVGGWVRAPDRVWRGPTGRKTHVHNSTPRTATAFLLGGVVEIEIEADGTWSEAFDFLSVCFWETNFDGVLLRFVCQSN